VGARKALDRELPDGQTAKSSLRPQTLETMGTPSNHNEDPLQPTVGEYAFSADKAA
jgi:hypothetical protein